MTKIIFPCLHCSWLTWNNPLSFGVKKFCCEFLFSG